MTGTIDAQVDSQTSASDGIADDIILMSVLLLRFSARTSNLIEQELRALADSLVKIVTAHDFTQSKLEAARSQRLHRILQDAEIAIRESFGAAGRSLTRDIRMAIEVAGEHAALSVNQMLGFERARVLDHDQVMALAGEVLVEGQTPVVWWRKLAGDAKFRFVRILQDAYTRRLSLEDLIAAIRGTGAKRFNDGFLGASWRAAAALARTSVASGAALARTAIWNAESDSIGSIVQISILDLRTSDICISYSRKEFALPKYEPIGHSLPYNGGVPRHFGCRSFEIPVVRAYDDLPARYQTRIAFQQRQGVFDGQPSIDLSYEDWLRTQSAATQKAALGGRYELWKSGSLTLEQMLDQSGHPLSIRELRKLAGM